MAFIDIDTISVGNLTSQLLEAYTPFAALRFKPTYLNSGVMVLKPRRDVFEALQRIFIEGDYPYFLDDDAIRAGRRALGDDDQKFFQHVFFAHRLPKVPGLKMHGIDKCLNDKGGLLGCNPAKLALLHKTPVWEARREDALWRAAVQGRCRANPELLNWRP